MKAVVLEDTAALIGPALAALGLLGSRLTGSGAWDGVASILIGVLLVVVAWAGPLQRRTAHRPRAAPADAGRGAR